MKKGHLFYALEYVGYIGQYSSLNDLSGSANTGAANNILYPYRVSGIFLIPSRVSHQFSQSIGNSSELFHSTDLYV